MTEQFDRHATTYQDDVDSSVRFSGRDVDYFARRKVEALLDAVRQLVGEPERLQVLDIGCGVGVTDRHLAPYVGALHGVDVAPEAVTVASATNPSVQYLSYDGTTLPYEDGTFDVALAICVLHHVEPPDRRTFVAEAARVVRPGGLVVVFEHNPYNPLTRLAVSRCEFDEGVSLLRRSEVTDLMTASGLTVDLERYILFAPFDAGWVRRLERSLSWLPGGAQHQVIGRVPLRARTDQPADPRQTDEPS